MLILSVGYEMQAKRYGSRRPKKRVTLNEEQVEKMVRIIGELSREVATSAEAAPAEVEPVLEPHPGVPAEQDAGSDEVELEAAAAEDRPLDVGAEYDVCLAGVDVV